MRWFDKSVWLCSNAYLPGTGGLVTYLRSASKALQDSGAKVRVLVTDSNIAGLPRTQDVGGVLVDRVAAYSAPALLKPLTPIIATAKIYSQLKKNLSVSGVPDFVIIRHIYYAVACSLIRELRERSVFIFPASAWKLELINLSGKRFVEKVYKIGCAFQLLVFEWFALRKIRRVGVLSKSKRDELLKDWDFSGDVVIAPPGVAMFSENNCKDLRDEVHEKLCVAKSGGRLILLVVCRLVEEKNVESLIRALIHVPYDAELWVVGDGPSRVKLEELAESEGASVVFWGNRSQVQCFYEVADVFVLPSKYEGFGHVFLEALSSGCPVVGVKADPPAVVTATEEIITNGVNGFIAENPSPAAIASAINNVIEALDRLKPNTSESVRGKYSWETHLETLWVDLNAEEG